MSDCLACTQQGHGRVHTCEGSGVAVAEAARDTGRVVDPPRVQTFDVLFSITTVGTRNDAEYVAAVLEQHCDRLGAVTEHLFAVSERVT